MLPRATKSFLFVAGAGITTMLALHSSVAFADTWTSHIYDTGDSRSYTGESPSDWDPGMSKAECAGTDRITGISGTNDAANAVDGAFARAAVCDSGAVVTGPTLYATHNLRTGSDDRADTGVGDWDVNNIKAECATNQVISGISQTYPNKLVSKILCRQSVCGTSGSSHFTSNEAACNTVMYSTVDNRLSSSGSDWSPGYMKNQCADNQLLKGVSVNSDGTIHLLLCCNYTQNICI